MDEANEYPVMSVVLNVTIALASSIMIYNNLPGKFDIDCDVLGELADQTKEICPTFRPFCFQKNIP